MSDPAACCARGREYLTVCPDDQEADPGWQHVRTKIGTPGVTSIVGNVRVRFCPFCGQSFAKLQPSTKPHSRSWTPVTGDFIVFCRDDSDDVGPGPFRIATRKSFPSLREACGYAAGIAPGRQPVVAMVYVHEKHNYVAHSCQKSTG